jgi:hypothetical protein
VRRRLHAFPCLVVTSHMYILRSNEWRPELTWALAGTRIPCNRPLPSPEFSKPPLLVSSVIQRGSSFLVPCCASRGDQTISNALQYCRYLYQVCFTAYLVILHPESAAAAAASILQYECGYLVLRSLSRHSNMDSSRCRYL